MTAPPVAQGAWAPAFPIGTASDAVEAVCESWAILSSRARPDFHRKSKEPHLTKVLKTHVEQVTAPRHGLIGMWAAENVINRVDFKTGAILEERRTDIVYGWNDHAKGYQLVMEFKKLGKTPSSRKHYLGDNGIGRFVSGMYAQGQPVAAMIGLLIDDKVQVVPKLCKEIASPSQISALRLQKNGKGGFVDTPSHLSPSATFDTSHTRPAPAGPPSGTIRVAHLFLEFGY